MYVSCCGAHCHSPIINSVSALRLLLLSHLDENNITSVPQTTFLDLMLSSQTNVTLEENPGIGTTPDVVNRDNCPNGSVFEAINVSSVQHPDLMLYGCIQCKVGTYHDNSSDSCRSCQDVSSRAYASTDGAVSCQYCPYSSDLLLSRESCLAFECNLYCWLTIGMGLMIPVLICCSKFGLVVVARSTLHQTKYKLAEMEDMANWRMEEMMRKLEPESSSDEEDEREKKLARDATRDCGSDNDDDDDEKKEATYRIYDLPVETQDVVIETVQEYFHVRMKKLRMQKDPAYEEDQSEEDDTAGDTGDTDDDPFEPKPQRRMNWDQLEWTSFQMQRLLSRNYHSEVFLGEYANRQVVVKRLMTLRFEVKALTEAVREVERMFALQPHPQIVAYLGTLWTEPTHFCVITEYVRGGDLHAMLALEVANKTSGGPSGLGGASAMSMGPMPMLLRSMSAGTSPSEASFSSQFTSDMMSGPIAPMNGVVGGNEWWPVKTQLMHDVSTALAYAHAQGISHQDLRSRNVLVTEHFRGKLNDFCDRVRTPKELAAVNASGNTNTTMRVRFNDHGDDDDDYEISKNSSLDALMLPLVAPEILFGSTIMDPKAMAADIYSCGLLLVELWYPQYVTFTSGDDLEPQYEERKRASSLSLSSSSYEDKHDRIVHRLLRGLRSQSMDSDELQRSHHSSSFGTATSSSMTLSFSSSTVWMDKLLATVEDCLQRDPMARPSARSLVRRFQDLLDDMMNHSHQHRGGA